MFLYCGISEVLLQKWMLSVMTVSQLGKSVSIQLKKNPTR